jgi:hypothetical protein
VLFGIFFCFASGSLMLVLHFLVWLHHFRRSIPFRYVGVAVIVTYSCAALPKRLTLSFSSLPGFIRWLYSEVASILYLDSTILFAVFLFTAVEFMLETLLCFVSQYSESFSIFVCYSIH